MIVGRIHGTLPIDITAFVGREALLERASRLLGHVRLLTLTGSGGVGKTRLALRILQHMAADGAWMIDIKALANPADRTPEGLYAHLALSLGIRHNGTADLDTILDHLRGRRVLLVLDNCESLVPQTRTFVRTLLMAAPQVRILATSRQALEVEGEHTVLVPPLAVADAVGLFVTQAVAAGADPTVLADDPDVEILCAKLDCLPLAINLAAALAPALSVRELLGLLKDRFRVLSDIEEIVAWSYQQCTTDEQRIWAIASVFTGPVGLAALTAIADPAGVASAQVTHLVAGLVRKSVLTADSSSGVTTYTMLNTVRDYGLRELDRQGAADHLRRPHSDYFQGVVAQAAESWFGPAELDVMESVHRQLPDILAVVDHCLVNGETAAARAICRNLVRSRAPFFWGSLGLVSQLLRRVLAASGSAADPTEAADIATTIAMAGWMAVTVGNSDDAGALIARAEGVLREHRMPTLPAVLFAIGGHKSLGDGLREGIGLLAAARDLMSGDELDGDRHMAMMVWAMSYAFAGEPEHAVDASCLYLREADEAKAPWAISWALWTSSLAALKSGDRQKATTYLNRCLQLQQDMDDAWGQTWSIALCVWILADSLSDAPKPREEARRAAWLLGAAQARQDKLGIQLAGLAPFASLHICARNLIGGHLSEHAVDVLFATGKRSHDMAIGVALGDPLPRSRRTTMRNGLSKREDQIVEAVAEGLTNKEIGNRLHITTGTVDSHVKRILAKLDLRNRTALAAWASSQNSSPSEGPTDPNSNHRM
ncbi:LuxR C-terminal-related transcriptional regulator [Actinoplanes sp. NPDC026619]|uniref:LuxR C-terminal-related transcriptional regulator n=1 Tax=Actinoplanes sp. NPDC026619 TaxID=3155798 RepID=UPI003401D519